MKLSIIIVNWNTRNDLRRCLESLFAEAPSFPFEVIVVDNASRDGSAEMVQKSFPAVRVIHNDRNLGFAKANNLGITESSGEYVLALNSDTFVLPHTLEKTVHYLEEHPDVAILGCKIMNPDGTVQPSVRREPKLMDQLLILVKLHHVFRGVSSLKRYFAHDFDYARTQTVFQVMGAYFLMRRSFVSAVNGFDTGYWIWFEEVDLCAKAAARKLHVSYFTDADIIHRKGESFQKMKVLTKQYHYTKSMIRYMRRHEGLMSALVLIFFAPLGFVFAGCIQLVEYIRGPIRRNKSL